MIIGDDDQVLVQGITGKQGTFWSERMIEYGTRIRAGVNPKKQASFTAAFRSTPRQPMPPTQHPSMRRYCLFHHLA